MQLALAYDPVHVGGDVWTAELAWLRRAVDALGHKHVAAEIDIAPSHLTDALLERERKAMKGEWIAKIRQMVDDGARLEWLRLVARPLGYEPERIKTLDAESELRLMREWMRRESPTLLRTFDKEIGK